MAELLADGGFTGFGKGTESRFRLLVQLRRHVQHGGSVARDDRARRQAVQQVDGGRQFPGQP
jgi:hypothetical protein